MCKMVPFKLSPSRLSSSATKFRTTKVRRYRGREKVMRQVERDEMLNEQPNSSEEDDTECKQKDLSGNGERR